MTHLKAAKDHEIWWEKSLGVSVSLTTFSEWIGSCDEPSRVAMRSHVAKMGYRSILDIPCGLCVDYWGFRKDEFIIDYTGVDITPNLVALAKELNIPIMEGDIEDLPFAASSFDICYARHILEHLESFQQALRELIRVAKREVLVVFFVKPQEFEHIDLSRHNGYLLYHNAYSKSQLEQFIQEQQKVVNFEWEEVSPKECILHLFIGEINVI